MDIPLVILLILLAVVSGIVIGWFTGVYFELKKRGKTDEEAIMSQVNESTERGTIEESEAVMINNIFEFGDKVAKDIMTDRSNIVALEATMKLDEAIETMLDNAYSRFPVYNESLDNIIGIMHLKDAIKFSRDKNNKKQPIGSIEGLLREAKCITETRKVDSLFSAMRAKRYQMVIVIDEYGQTAGVVAMRDILEEIVGDIDDEFEKDDSVIVAQKDNKYVIEGMMKLEDIEELLGIEFDDENFETINGYMISKMEHIPDSKERFVMEYSGYEFKVLSVENKMIKQILVTKIVNNDTRDLPETEITQNI